MSKELANYCIVLKLFWKYKKFGIYEKLYFSLRTLTVLDYIQYILLLAFKIYLYEKKLEIRFVVLCHNEEKIPKWFGYTLLSRLSCKNQNDNNKKHQVEWRGPLVKVKIKEYFKRKAVLFFFKYTCSNLSQAPKCCLLELVVLLQLNFCNREEINR